MTGFSDILPDELDPKEVDCVEMTFKPCFYICQQRRSEELKNLPCCMLSRCQACIEDEGIDACGQRVQGALQNIFQLLLHVTQSCQENEQFPSFKCYYYWFPVWFYIIPAMVFLLVSTLVIVVVLVKRHRRRRNDESRLLYERRKRRSYLRRYNSTSTSNEYVEDISTGR